MDSLLEASRLRDRQPSPSFVGGREDDLVDLMKNADFDTRLQALNRIIAHSKRDSNWFATFQRKGDLFKNIDKILVDDRWEVQHQAIRFLMEAMPTFGKSLDFCICYVMPNIIPKLGSSKITLRKMTSQAVQTFLHLQPQALSSFLKMLSNYLQTATAIVNRNDVLNEVPTLFLPELKEKNWYSFLDALIRILPNADPEGTEAILTASKKLEEFLGVDSFKSTLSDLPIDQQAAYTKATSGQTSTSELESNSAVSRSKSGERRFRFGIVPSFISAMIMDDNDVAQRLNGLEQLKQILEQLTPEDITRFVPHLHSYLISLSHILADLNFKVVVLALDVLRQTVAKLKTNMDAHLQQVISLLSKHFGNQKAVVKQILMMTFIDLFQNFQPKSVFALLAVFLEHKNPRIREEVINIMTAALMMISPSRINIKTVINLLLPLLLDPKKRVRVAAFEQLSVVAHLMGGKTEPLIKAVRAMESKQEAEGLSAAVTARINRQQLPKIRYDGLIEYSHPPPSADVTYDEHEAVDNADMQWIMTASDNDNERSSSPSFQAVATMNQALLRISANANKRRQPMPWEADMEAEPIPIPSTSAQSHPLPSILDRMKSDDLIVRNKEKLNHSELYAVKCLPARFSQQLEPNN